MSCCHPQDMPSTDSDDAAYRHLLIQFTIAILLGVTLFLGEWLQLSPTIRVGPAQWFWGAVSLIVLAVLYYSGKHFYIGAWKSLRAHTATMDTLVAMGTTAAWLYSSIIILIPYWLPQGSQHVYFDTALMIIAFIDLGAALEIKARGKTSQAINSTETAVISIYKLRGAGPKLNQMAAVMMAMIITKGAKMEAILSTNLPILGLVYWACLMRAMI